VTPKESIEQLGARYAAEAARFAAFTEAVKRLAPSVPSLVVGESTPHALAFTFAGIPCQLLFEFQPSGQSYLVVSDAANLLRVGNLVAPFDGAGRVTGAGAGPLSLADDAEAVFFALLAGRPG
jgi:hypothetical protein